MAKFYSPEQFRELCKEFQKQEKTILDWKGEEYSTEADRIQNFREIANFIGNKPITISPAMVAFVYLMKHVQSIKNALVSNRVDWRWEAEGGEGTKQRVADVRNYLLLLSACVDEQDREDERWRGVVKEMIAMGFREMPMVGEDTK